MDEWIERNFVKRKQTANGHNWFAYFSTFVSTVIGNYPWKSPDISCSYHTAQARQNKAPFA